MSDPSKAIRAEREYRKRLTEQHLGIRHHFDDHKNDLAEVFATRIEPQTLHLDRLYSFIHSRRTATRFLEVGAEKGHLGIHLVNRHGLKGVSIDLSLDALRLAAPVVQVRMQAKTRPPAASADVHALPFRDRTFDMVFCFSSLHHFYDPDLALEEIRRVLASKGVFFCSWEPMCPVFRPKQVGGSEVEWGVLENRYTYFQLQADASQALCRGRDISCWTFVVTAPRECSIMEKQFETSPSRLDPHGPPGFLSGLWQLHRHLLDVLGGFAELRDSRVSCHRSWQTTNWG